VSPLKIKIPRKYLVWQLCEKGINYSVKGLKTNGSIVREAPDFVRGENEIFTYIGR
jgi:hypothetical protein